MIDFTDRQTTIREADVGDVPAIASAHAASWRAGSIDRLPPEILDKAIEKRCSASRWQSIFDAPEFAAETLLVAEKGNEIVGLAQAGPDQEGSTRVQIYRFYVVPSEWGKGVAQLLMESMLGVIAERGCPEVFLWTMGAGRTRRFYEKSRFEKTSRSREFNLYDDVVATEIEYGRPTVFTS